MIDRQEFLDVIFGDITDDEHVCVSRATPKKVGDDLWWTNYTEDARQWRKWSPEDKPQAWYFNVCTVTGELNEKQTMVSRGRANLMRYYVLVLDDIGQKTGEPPVAPTYKLESSIESFQWGYALVPGEDLARFEALIEAIHQKGWGDAGAGGSYRVMRVPGSANIKPGRQNFRSVITEWSPDRYWTLDELAEAFGVDMNAVEVRPASTVDTKSGGAVAMDGIDPMLDWLVDGGYVVTDKGEWVDVICPWADSHTSGANTAGYSPLGRGAGDWVQRRAFKCLHEHCAGKKLGDLNDWAGERGGPKVSGFDPLPWLQARYSYIVVGQRIADLEQRLLGGDWLLDFADWGNLYKSRVRIPSRDAPIELKTAFLEAEDTNKAMNAVYDPRSGADPHVTRNEQLNVNLYIPPRWDNTDADPVVFLEHVRYLFGSYADLFLDWLAWKYQNPGRRSWAIICVAHAAFGIGRSWLKRALETSLQGHVRGVSLGQMIGRGTSAEQNYNDWGTACQFVVVEEAKDTLSKDDFFNGYEAFKQNVDNNVVRMRVNPKYGKTRDDYLFFNALIFSNHADAMVIPEDDRRCCVLDNPTDRRSAEYYEDLNACLLGDEPRRIYCYLMRRDVSGFDHVYPPMTDAKIAMREQSISPAEEVQAAVLEGLKGDIVTRELLLDRVRTESLTLGYDNIYKKPGGVTSHLWRSCINLRGEKRGARYTISGAQVEVRAWRNKVLWIEVDGNRDSETIIAELQKTQGVGIMSVVVGGKS